VNPSKGKEIDLLRKMIGNWTVDLKVKMPDGSMLKGRGTVKARELSMDRGVYTEVRLDVTGMGAYHEDDLWGFDEWERKMHFYSVTSTGAVHDHVGTWKNERTLEFHWEAYTRGKRQLKMSLSPGFLITKSTSTKRIHRKVNRVQYLTTF